MIMNTLFAKTKEYLNIKITQKDINHIISHYDGGILYMDSLIQDFFEENSKLLDNTIVIIFSDYI